MKPRCVDRFLDVHAVVDDVEDAKHHHVMIRLPPGVPTTITGFPSRETIVGLIELNGRLPGAMEFASP